MREEIAFENGRISDFQGLVTLTLTLDRVILHTVMRHSSTSKRWNQRNFFVDGRTYGQANGHLRPTVLGRLGGFDLKIYQVTRNMLHKYVKTKQKNHSMHYKWHRLITINDWKCNKQLPAISKTLCAFSYVNCRLTVWRKMTKAVYLKLLLKVVLSIKSCQTFK